MNIKSIISILLILLCTTEVLGQENKLLSRDYWKSNPSLEETKSLIATGTNPSELNNNAFDAVVYALLEKANDEVIKYLLTFDGNDVEKRTHDSRTYIFWAAYKGNINIMKHLFEKGAAINIRDSHGNTPVTFAAGSGQKNQEVYNLFIKNGALLTQEKNDDGINALFLIAPYLESEKELNYFTSKGFNLKEIGPNGNNIFNYAAKSGNIELLKILLKKGVNPKVINNDGGNAILYASLGMRNSQYSIETFQFLEGLGINVNVVGGRGRNPLHSIASQSTNLDLYSYFIKKGVNVNLQDAGGNTPFMNAANRNELKTVKYLSNYIKDINIQNERGNSALALAVNRNALDVVEFLLKKGADIHTKDKKGNSLSYYLLNTFRAKDPKVFEEKLTLLQKHGLSLNQNQYGGNTLLHLATKENNLALIKRLISFGIDINAKNEEGYTPLHIAAMKAENDNILKYLLSQSADKTIKTEFDETALDLASENEQLQKIKLNFLK